jgi:hypothetical protein
LYNVTLSAGLLSVMLQDGPTIDCQPASADLYLSILHDSWHGWLCHMLLVMLWGRVNPPTASLQLQNLSILHGSWHG